MRVKSFRLWLPLTWMPLKGLLLSLEPLASLVPGEWGQRVRLLLENGEGMMDVLGNDLPRELVHVEVGEGDDGVEVQLKTHGWGGGKV